MDMPQTFQRFTIPPVFPTAPARSLCGAMAALVLFSAAVLLPNTMLQAQLTSGAITGVVYDSSGAVIAGSTVTVTDLATGAKRAVGSNASGYYTIPSLPPTVYELAAAAAGFQAATVKITVTLGATTDFDFHLSPGNVSQSIQVSASSSSLELEKSSHQVESLVPTQHIENLPANGRDLFQVLESAASVTPFQNAPGPVSNFRTYTNNVTIGGSAPGTTTYLQDGVTNIAMLTKTANFQPPIEATQEVSIIQNGASARYDEPSVVNVITKGGTNDFHGRAYDYLENDALDTIGYFKVRKPALRYNQFGANIGGPIIKNKLFFFFDYSGLREGQGTTLFANVPTSAERQGDFSQDSFTIYDPSTYDPQTKTISPFPNNKIPTNRISSFGSAFLNYYPTPTGSVLAGDNFEKNVDNTTSYNSYLARVDYTLSAKNTLYGAYESTNPNVLDPSFTPNSIFNYINVQTAKNAYLQETHVFNTNTINVGRFGFNDSHIYYATLGTGKANYVADFGLPALNPATSQSSPPAVSLTTHTGLGNPVSPQGALQRLYEFTDEVNLIRGKHYIYIGGQLSNVDFNANWTVWNNGQFTFNGQYTSDHNSAKLSGGSDLADLLLGFPQTAMGGTGVTIADFRQWNVVPYIQDDWRISKKLTLNLGLRYDYYGAPDDANGHSNVYDVYNNTNHSGTFHQSYYDFAPRVGFAYSASANTVFHGGYGIYYTPFQYTQLQFLMINQPNFYLQLNTYALANPTSVMDTFSTHPTLSAEAPFTIQLGMRTPYVQQWNLSVQRSLGSNWLATVSYLGNKSDHLQIRQNPNQATPPVDPGNPTPIQSRRPYPYVGDVYQIASIGYGNYNALEAEIDRHYSNGLSLVASYMWSKSLDALNNGAEQPEYGPNVQAEYGMSDFNPPQVFKASGVYELPFGTGKSILGRQNWFDTQVLGGWQGSGILTVQSGLPFNATANDLSQTGGYHSQRANQVCNGNRPANQSIRHWFSTACYVQPGIGQLGNEKRDNILGPRTTNLDLSLFKAFHLREGASLQFRSDFFDALNHPLLGTTLNGAAGVSANVAASTYGEVTNITGARIVQLSLKLIY